jgi:hypothetical protein
MTNVGSRKTASVGKRLADEETLSEAGSKSAAK